MNQKKVMSSARSGVGTGTTSLLMIFTVLCFATLAMLSLSTAAANQRIQQRGMNTAAATAAARGQAAEKVAELDTLLVELGEGWTATNEAWEKKEAEAQAEGMPPSPGIPGDYLLDVEGIATGAMGWTSMEDDFLTLQLITPVDKQNELVTEIKINPLGDAERYTVLRQQTRLADGWEAEEDLGLWPGA